MAIARRYVLVPGLLEIHSNAKSIAGFLAPLCSIANGEPGDISLSLKVTGAMAGPSRGATPFGAVWGESDADDVYYCPRLLGSLSAQLRLQGLRDSPQIRVNRTYHRLVRLRVGNVQPAGRHLADVVAVKLLQHGYALVHAAALAFDGRGILLAAPPGGGKSLTALRAVERGFSFLAEDVAITDGEWIYGLPLTASFAWDIGGKELGLKSRSARLRMFLQQRLTGSLPPLAYLFPFPSPNILSLAPQACTQSQAPLSFIFILGRGPRKVVSLSPQEALAKLLPINRSEFSYYQNNVLLGYSYFNPWLNLGELARKEEQLLAMAVGNTACFSCQGPDPASFIEQIQPIVAD